MKVTSLQIVFSTGGALGGGFGDYIHRFDYFSQFGEDICHYRAIWEKGFLR